MMRIICLPTQLKRGCVAKVSLSLPTQQQATGHRWLSWVLPSEPCEYNKNSQQAPPPSSLYSIFLEAALNSFLCRSASESFRSRSYPKMGQTNHMVMTTTKLM
jgi:hypothetical protein